MSFSVVLYIFNAVNAFVGKGVTIFKWWISHLGINLFILKSTQPCRIIPYYPICDCWAAIARIWGNCLNPCMNDSCLTALQQLSNNGWIVWGEKFPLSILQIYGCIIVEQNGLKNDLFFSTITLLFHKLQCNLLNLIWTFLKSFVQLIERSVYLVMYTHLGRLRELKWNRRIYYFSYLFHICFSFCMILSPNKTLVTKANNPVLYKTRTRANKQQLDLLFKAFYLCFFL